MAASLLLRWRGWPEVGTDELGSDRALKASWEGLLARTRRGLVARSLDSYLDREDLLTARAAVCWTL